MATKVAATNKKWQRWENNPVQSPSGGLTIALSRTAKPVAAGDYKVSFGCELRIDSPGANAFAKVQCEIDGNIKNEFVTKLDEFSTHNGWDFIHFAEGETPQIRMQFRRVNPGGTVEIRKVKMSIERKKEG